MTSEDNLRFNGPWQVVERNSNTCVESHATKESAMRACAILNDHERQYGQDRNLEYCVRFTKAWR